MGRELTPPRGSSHVVQRCPPQLIPAFSSGGHRPLLPMGLRLGWTEGSGTDQGNAVGERAKYSQVH